MTENEANMDIKYAVCVLESIGNGLALKNENDKKDACILAIQAIDKVQAFEAIGTIEEFKALKEKSTPKKVAYQGEHEKCPTCGSFHVFGKHCTECGQVVDYD